MPSPKASPLPMPKAMSLLLPFPMPKALPLAITLPILTKIAKGVTIDFPKPPLTFPMPKALPLGDLQNDRPHQLQKLRTTVRRVRDFFPP